MSFPVGLVERQIEFLCLSGEFNVEDSYRFSEIDKLCDFEKVLELFPLATLYPIELVSKSGDDIVLVFGVTPTDLVLRFFNVSQGDMLFMDYFAVKVNVKEGVVKLKLYVSNVEFVLQELSDYEVATNLFGVGLYFDVFGNRGSTLDVYFFHKDVEEVLRAYRVPHQLEMFTPTQNLALFGLTACTEHNTILKVKRYLYPHDVDIRLPNAL